MFATTPNWDAVGALVAQARTAEGSRLIDWQPDDTVMAHEFGGP